MSTVSVKLNSKAKHPFIAHRVSASFFSTFSGDDLTKPLQVPGKVTVLVDAAGMARLELPPKETLVADRKLIFRVTAPDGQELAIDESKIEVVDSQEVVTISVDPKEILPIQRNTDQAFLKPNRIRGLLIDPTGNNRVGGKQVLLLARSAAEESLQVVAAALSDGRGYFSAPFPLGNFVAAFSSVGGGEQATVHLNDDGSFPDRLMLGIPSSGDGGTGADTPCSGKNCVPRDPDDIDLVNSPETFSTDLGGGNCIDMTKPNRVLQEFDFYTVVRSTEPQIRGLTVTEPPKVGLDDIIRIVDSKLVNFAVQSLPQTTTAFTPGSSLTTRAALLRAPTVKTRGLGNVDPDSVVSIALEESHAELNHLGEAIGLAALKTARTPPPGGTSPLEGIRIDAEIAKTLAQDPDGFSLTRLARAEILTRKNDLLRIIELIRRGVPARANLSCDNAFDWDADPTFFQACTIAHGHILHFKQQYMADGYSLGDLLYSLPLAPCQKKQIAIIDWDRRESAARQESLQEQEFLSAQLSRDRDISEIASAVVSESMTAGSEASTSSFGGGLGIGAIIPPFGGLLGIGGGSSSSGSTAFQNSARSTSANSLQQLRDRVNQAATAVRSQRSTVIQTVNQGESMRVQTEYVANHNHCHAITMEYFEVLRHFLVRHHLADVQECLLVPLLMSRFDAAKALRWREPLARNLRDRRLRRGFEALQRIADNYLGSDMPTGSYAEDELTYLDGWLRLQFRIQRPRDTNDGSFLEAAWNSLSWLGISPNEFWKSYLEGQLERDRIFAESLGPRIAEEITNGLRFFAVDENSTETLLPIDSSLISEFRNDLPLQVSLRLRTNLPALRRDRIKFIRIGTTIDTNAGPRNIDTILPLGSKIIVSSGQMGYRTAHLAHDLFSQTRIVNDLSGTDGVLIFTPLSRQELRRPREEDKEYANNLLKYLNDHLEQAHRFIWVDGIDAQRRFMLLDGFIAPNSGGRSVASVVENRLIGIVGNCLVMPVARGFHLDPTFAQDEEHPIDLLDHYQPTTPIAPLRLAVPTKGVFAEAVMGSCNSCEPKDESRFWRFEESPCPGEPPPIQTVSTESRRTEPPNLTPSPFPAPIVAFQNVPAAPDPQGFAGLLELLAKPDLFRDITGLSENQKNALAGLQAALGTAQFFGGKAADLALQANMNKDIDKALDKINEQHKSGAINDQQRSQLTEAALRGMIGGGSQAAAEPISTQEVKDLTNTAGANDAAVTLARPGGETVSVNAQAQGLDFSPKTFIILPSPQNDPDSRAFFPSRNDKSATIEVLAQLTNAPSGGSHRWTRTDVDAMQIDSQGSLRTIVRGLKSGLHELDFTVRDASGVAVASQKLQLSIPQFVTIDEGGNSSPTPFDDFLSLFQLSARKDDLLREAKQVCDFLLSTTNVRTIWRIGPFTDTLPAHLPAANVTGLTIHNEPPPALAGVPGVTLPPAGATVLNETIQIFPGALDDPSSHDISVEVLSLLLQIQSLGMTQALEDFATTLLGRLLGLIMSHEIVHSLLAFDIPTGHNSPMIPGDLMNNGADFTFTEATGFEDTAHVSPVDPANFIDHGLTALAFLKAVNQGRVDLRFPVPPSFS